MPLSSSYNPKEFESKIYAQWQEANLGKPETQIVNQSSKPKILFATTNWHKIKLFKIAWTYQELDKIYDLITLRDLPKKELGHIEENSGTFDGDAKIKALAYAKAYNLPTISQDRGFVFDAINWPGTDSKKAMYGSEEKIFSESHVLIDEKEENLNRARSVLDKISGKDRSMRVIQGLAVAMPDGQCQTELFETLGEADTKVTDNVGGSFDRFFIPEGLGHVLADFETEDMLDDYVAKNFYPITPKILGFLQEKTNSQVEPFILGNKLEKIDNYRENVRVVLYDPKTDLYAIQRGVQKASGPWPLLGDGGVAFNLLGGGLEEGELKLDTLKRELVEESGYLDTTIIDQLGTQIDCYFVEDGKSYRRLSTGFLVVLNSDIRQEVKLEESEKLTESECIWVSKEEIMSKLSELSEIDFSFSYHLEFFKRGVNLIENVIDTYSVLMPPPNLTGGLHAGHAFQHYIMDTLTRIHRQKGKDSLWYPGVDHAGIQLEGVIDKLIKKGEFDEDLKGL